MNRNDVRLLGHFDRGRVERRRPGNWRQIFPYALMLPYSATLRGNMSAVVRISSAAARLHSAQMRHASHTRPLRIGSDRVRGRKDLHHHPPFSPAAGSERRPPLLS